jgi:hypothetical protein
VEKADRTDLTGFTAVTTTVEGATVVEVAVRTVGDFRVEPAAAVLVNADAPPAGTFGSGVDLL